MSNGIRPRIAPTMTYGIVGTNIYSDIVQGATQLMGIVQQGRRDVQQAEFQREGLDFQKDQFAFRKSEADRAAAERERAFQYGVERDTSTEEYRQAEADRNQKYREDSLELQRRQLEAQYGIRLSEQAQARSAAGNYPARSVREADEWNARIDSTSQSFHNWNKANNSGSVVTPDADSEFKSFVQNATGLKGIKTEYTEDGRVELSVSPSQYAQVAATNPEMLSFLKADSTLAKEGDPSIDMAQFEGATEVKPLSVGQVNEFGLSLYGALDPSGKNFNSIRSSLNSRYNTDQTRLTSASSSASKNFSEFMSDFAIEDIPSRYNNPKTNPFALNTDAEGKPVNDSIAQTASSRSTVRIHKARESLETRFQNDLAKAKTPPEVNELYSSYLRMWGNTVAEIERDERLLAVRDNFMQVNAGSEARSGVYNWARVPESNVPGGGYEGKSRSRVKRTSEMRQNQLLSAWAQGFEGEGVSSDDFNLVASELQRSFAQGTPISPEAAGIISRSNPRFWTQMKPVIPAFSKSRATTDRGGLAGGPPQIKAQ